MITGKEIYGVLSVLVPMYFATFLAFASVRWCKLFTPVQCSGINSFVATFAIPLLCLNLVTTFDPYTMNIRLFAVDIIQKVVVFAVLLLWKKLSKKCTFEHVITLLSISTLPNTLILGVPLLGAMYGANTSGLLLQFVVLQAVIWFSLLLCLYEYRAARILIAQRFPETAETIASIRVDSDVVSLNGLEQLETDSEVDSSGRLHVRVRHSRTSSLGSFSGKEPSAMSSRISSLHLQPVFQPQEFRKSQSYRKARSQADLIPFLHSKSAYARMEKIMEELPIVNPPAAEDKQHKNAVSIEDTTEFSFPRITSKESEDQRGTSAPAEAPSNTAIEIESNVRDREEVSHPSTGVMIKLVTVMVLRKVVRNPTLYASVVGLIWSLIAYRYKFEMPEIVRGCITIISKAGGGLSMFSLGLFTALQPKFLACGKLMAVTVTLLRFIAGPASTAAPAVALGLRGLLLQAAIVQAALPMTTVCFVFANEYNVHPEIISTSVITSAILALPISIVYYVLLGLRG